MILPADILAVLAWICAGQTSPAPRDLITTFAIVAELEDRGLIDHHGDVTPKGRETLSRERL